MRLENDISEKVEKGDSPKFVNTLIVLLLV